MGQTLIEKIISEHRSPAAKAGDIVDVNIDMRAARDFGGASVIKNLQRADLGVADPHRTISTFIGTFRDQADKPSTKRIARESKSTVLQAGLIRWPGGELLGQPFSAVQMSIYQRGGLLHS